ncbi:MAG: DUF3718 domain-containing protein [Gammaproteobacteria bacterium]|nr:DUF3718 domain-containing protein [Gammaproteobacteria bacterium]
MKGLIACTLALAVVLPVPAAADDMGRVLASVCEYTKANDRGNLRKKLDGAGLDLRRVYDAIVCPGGMSLLRVATEAGAVDAATFIATKVGKNALGKAEKDGKSPVAWAEEKVAAADANGKALMQPVLDMLKAKSQ